MADTQTPNLLLTNQENGTNENTWGDKVDENWERLDNILGDTLALSSLSGGSVTLTDVQELVLAIECTGTLLLAQEIIFSGRGGFWAVKNSTAGSFPLTCKVSGQTGVIIPQGTTKVLYSNGTDLFEANPESAAADEETVASAATTDILGTTSEFVAISGTATITSFGTGTNRKRFVRATGAFTITHDATSLICPTGENITAAVGDTFLVISDASSNARIYGYQRVSGQALKATTPIGAVQQYLGSAAPTNWLLLNGASIGNSSSGGTARASDTADTQALFSLLWNQFSNTELPIQDSAGTPTARGVDAATDFAANKRMPLPDASGRVIAGKEATATRLTTAGSGINGSTLGAAGGSEAHALVDAELPVTNLVVNTDVNDPGHGHDIDYQASDRGPGPGQTTIVELGNGVPTAPAKDAQTNITVDVTIDPFGGGQSHTNTQPTIVLCHIVYAGIG